MNYTFHSSISTRTRNRIKRAMQELSKISCLRFQLTNSTAVHRIEFRSDKSGCYSTSIGRNTRNLKTIINLQNPGCVFHRIILHEIYHAIGFWHEQSQPDRDQFVTINHTNISPRRGHNFMRRNSYEVDNQGSTYDYGSIMHYSRLAFSKNRRPTIIVNNIDVYNKQGRPTLGRQTRLSARDIRQVNRLYNCPGSGLYGVLTVHVNDALGIPEDGDSDMYIYVRMTARDDTNYKLTQQTEPISTSSSENRMYWNQTLSFGERAWQNVEVNIWRFRINPATNSTLTDPQTFSTQNGKRVYRHCDNVGCFTSLNFDVNLEQGCDLNPCLNGGSCTNHSSGFLCSCRTGYTGSQCQFRNCFPNPCLNGGSCTNTSTGYRCNCMPGLSGNQCQIDHCSPNPCLNGGSCIGLSSGYRCNCTTGYTGSQCQINRCSPNPCLNGGSCTALSSGYRCNCTTGYGGRQCQTQPNLCFPNPCLHGGRCISYSPNYYLCYV